MSTTTTTLIRNRIETVIVGTTPSVYPGTTFTAYRDASGADFRRWARAHPSLCTRRVQVRTSSSMQSDVSNMDREARLATFEIIVAYSKRWRAGQAFDRDDTLEADHSLIERAVGRDGYQNFTGANPNATWLKPGATGSRTGSVFERATYQPGVDNVDFLVITQTMRFYRTVT
jgi:hypothetical protein